MIFHIAVCSPDAVLRGRVQRHCLEYYARRADACIVEQLEDAGALLRKEDAGSRFELYLIELTAANPAAGLQAAAQLRQRGVRAPLAFLAHTPAYAYEAFRVDAMQYLQIPFRPEQLTALLDRATEPEYGPVIPVTTSTGLRALPFADIEYLECTHHVVHFHLASGEDVASLSLRVPFSEVAKPLLRGQPGGGVAAVRGGAVDAQRCPRPHPPRPRSCREGSLPEVFGTVNDRKEVLSKRARPLFVRTSTPPTGSGTGR